MFFCFFLFYLTFIYFIDILKDANECRLLYEGVNTMNKNRVQVKIGGATYTIVTEDDSQYVEDLADYLNNEIRSICNANPALSMTQAAVLVALDQLDACKKASASADNLRVQIKDYLEESARAKMEVEVARREVERLNREIADLRNRINR